MDFAPHPNTPTRQFRIAKLVLLFTRPLDAVTMWAARVVVEDRMRKAGILVSGDPVMGDLMPSSSTATTLGIPARTGNWDVEPWDENEDV